MGTEHLHRAKTSVKRNIKDNLKILKYTFSQKVRIMFLSSSVMWFIVKEGRERWETSIHYQLTGGPRCCSGDCCRPGM